MASPSTARTEAAAGRPLPIGISGKLRIGLRGAAMLLMLLICLPLHYLWRLVGRASLWPRVFLGAVARIAGVRVHKIGQPISSNVVYVSNHVSWLDILGLAGATGSTFVAKAELERAPIVGWLASLNHTVYVARDDRRGVADQIARVATALAGPRPLALFPEGTTGDGRSLLPFKSTLLKMLEAPLPGLRVQPLLLDYGAAGPEIAWLGVEGGMHNALRILARPGQIRLDIHFLAPLAPGALPDRKAIAAACRARIAAALESMTGVPTPDFIGHDHWARGSKPL